MFCTSTNTRERAGGTRCSEAKQPHRGADEAKGALRPRRESHRERHEYGPWHLADEAPEEPSEEVQVSETVNERRARENAERIAAHKRATAITPVPTRDELVAPTRSLYDRRKVEEAATMAEFYIERAESLRRQQKLGPLTADEIAAIKREHGAA